MIVRIGRFKEIMMIINGISDSFLNFILIEAGSFALSKINTDCHKNSFKNIKQ